jgi:hypothetical protein
MSQEIAGSARSKFGTWSLIVAALAFSIGIVSLAVYLGLPDDSSDFAKSTATWTFIAGFIGLAPLLHVIGFVFGLIAVFRPYDSRFRGALGLLFNSVAVAIAVGLVWLGLHALAAFT